MDQHRWLLPFTYGLNMRAIAEVMSVADAAGATLVAVALIGMPTRPGNRGIRLEHIQQTKDFLEAVNTKAMRLGLPVERHEMVTRDVIARLKTLISELQCDAIVLLSRKGEEIFLETYQFKQALDSPPAPLVLIRLPDYAEQQGLWKRILSRIWQSEGGQDDIGQTISEQEEPLWIRMEEHQRR